MKKAWKPYGVDVKLKAHSINKIIEKEQLNMTTQDQLDKIANRLQQNKRSKV